MCTTVIVGKRASYDGSLLMARSADSSALKAQYFVIHPQRDFSAGALYRSKDHNGATDFTYPQPAHAMRYTTVPNWETRVHGAVGFNEAGLGITGTETIFARDDALLIDPYNEVSGITEDDIPDILLPRCNTAREAVALLGKIIETQGAGEGFGVGFSDSNETWYLETGTGHQWMARRLPEDVYFATGNQGRFKAYVENSEDFLGSPTLIAFAKENGFYHSEDGAFNFSTAYTRDDERDRIFNDPRVWRMQKVLNPSIEQDPQKGRDYPEFLKPEQPITVDDLKAILRDHYNGSEHDPYGKEADSTKAWRPISVFRTYEAHVLQIRPWMPKAIGNVIHIAFGMADLSCFMPFYAGLKQVPEYFEKGNDQADDVSLYWKFRKLQTLAMTDYSTLAPIVKGAFVNHEKAIEARCSALEKRYLELSAHDEAAADALLQKENLAIFESTEVLIQKLMNELFTVLTQTIEKKVLFANGANKD